MQEKIERLSRNDEGISLKINISKTKVLRLNADSQDPQKEDDTVIESVKSFVCLGTIVDNLIDDVQDIQAG